jgi:hypothetical protein
VSDDGPLGWLAAAQRSHRAAVDLWEPFESRLRGALADLRESTFLICEVPGPQAADGKQGSKYLQYLLTEDGEARVLVAEASALRYQGVVDDTASAQQALIDAMGWTRPDGGNHVRTYPWPHDLDPVVDDSMRILRDVWGVSHPALIRIGDPQSMAGPGVVPAFGTDEQILAQVSAWFAELGARPIPTDASMVLVEVFDEIIAVSPDAGDSSIEVSGVLGALADARAAAVPLLEAVAEDALVGCVSLTSLEDGATLGELRLTLALEGLTAAAFGRHVRWLAGSTTAVTRRLDEQGLFA